MSVFQRVASALEGWYVPDRAHRQAHGEPPSFEVRTYQDQDGRTRDYFVGTVEFDDQGWFQDRAQKDVLFQRLKEHRDQTGDQYLIVAFAHGWLHNADPEDPHVKEFHDLLESLDLLEEAAKANGGKRRKVVGVYVSWRGKSIAVQGAKFLTFWTRKNAAGRVGERSVKQLVMELNQFRAVCNGWDRADQLAGPDQTQLVLVGHSFGGLIMYHALNTELMERCTRVRKDGRYRPAKSFGDFALLVNPAFEGVAFETLWRAAVGRCYADSQHPILAVVTSQTDLATKYAFPLGRLYTFSQSAPHKGERETVLNTVGHLRRYRTHELSAVDAKRKPARTPLAQRPRKSIQDARESLARLRAPQGAAGTYGPGVLKPVPNPEAPPNLPYLVISARTEMIKDHSDIWNDRFRDFMRDFIVRQIMDAPPGHAEPECSMF